MKKKVMLIVDTLIVIFLSIQIQSTIVFIEERFSYLQNYTWDDFLSLYTLSGIFDMISGSSWGYIYHVFFEFLCNSSKDKRYKKKSTYPWGLSMVYCDKYIFYVIEDN